MISSIGRTWELLLVHQQQGRDQRRLPTDAISIVVKNCSADRTGDKADRINREGLQSADQRVRFREVQLGKNQTGYSAVQKEVVLLYRGPDRAGDYRTPQLYLVLDLGKRVGRIPAAVIVAPEPRNRSSSTAPNIIFVAIDRGLLAPAGFGNAPKRASVTRHTTEASKAMPRTTDPPPAITPSERPSK